MPTVNETITTNGTTAVSGATVKIRTYPGVAYHTAGDKSIIGEVSTTTDANGLWTATLVACDLLNPAGTVYVVDVRSGNVRSTRFISVPNGAGPYIVEDILTDQPGEVASDATATALTAHLGDTTDAHDASAISVLDTAGNYTGTDVETVLAELPSRFAPSLHAPTPQRAFKDRMASARGPQWITCVGDSTGNDSTDWFYPFVSAVAAAYPAWNVYYRLWNDTNQLYDRPTVVQTGTAGNGYASVGGFCTVTKTAANTCTSCDVMIRAKVRKTALASGTEATIFAQTNTNQWAQQLYVSSTGALIYRYSVDGSTLVSSTIATAGEMDTAFNAGEDFYVGVTFDRSNGSNSVAQAIKSTDGVTWANFGTADSAKATVAGLWDSTANPGIGARTGANFWDGRIYWVEVYKSMDGTSPALRFDGNYWNSDSQFYDDNGGSWAAGTTTFTAGAPTLIVMNGSISGKGLSWFDDATRRPLMLSAKTDLLIVNTGHNEGFDMLSAYKTFVDNCRTLHPGISVVACKQNPQHSTATNYRRHNLNMMRLGNLAAGQGWGVIDAFQVYEDLADTDAYIETASVHPIDAASYALWTAEALRSFILV